MKFHLNQSEGNNAIHSCEANSVVVNQTRHDSSFILTPTQLIENWQPRSADDITPQTLAAAAALAAAGTVVLLGIGEKAPPPQAEWQQPFIVKQAVLEVMNLRAACRTYNILMSDSRAVVAALVLSQTR